MRNLDRIDEESIRNGLSEFSNDLVIEADREISDVEPRAKGVIYALMKEPTEMFGEDLRNVIAGGLKRDTGDKLIDVIIDFLLYFGFLGIRTGDDDPEFAYDFHYNIQLLQSARHKYGELCIFCVHPAFWPALKMNAH